jgi:drug/metabolite transporter (DMT)-like permease
VVQLAVPVVLFARSARYLPAVLLSLFALMESLLSPLWVFLAVGETPTWETVLGGGMILGAVTLVLLRRG